MEAVITRDELKHAIELIVATHTLEELAEYHFVYSWEAPTLGDVAKWFAIKVIEAQRFSSEPGVEGMLDMYPATTRVFLEGLNS